MARKTIAGKTIEVTDEGYLVNPNDWDQEIAKELAAEEGIAELSEQHWKVIDFLRKDFQERGSVAGVRRLNRVAGISTKELYELFPHTPIKKAAKIAGLPKPTSCV